ncbi:MAG: hypothetical protein KDD73_11370 [Anaerolineales bacterium]|nr:hypothetical protein [Anaerolineales bacterium]MCB9172264.1 N(G),N(G)-dimethylarginine dimethylaminohydrolase [Ardenticatenales bacterium]
MKFNRAIVREPGRSLIDGLTSLDLGRPDYETALRQHRAYVAAMQRCGLEVIVLPPDEAHPDSTFVEDVALLTRNGAIITRPGAPSRRGETAGMAGVLSSYFDRIERIEPPGTIDGGDIMKVGDHFYIGLSRRTNEAGARQMIAHLEGMGLSGSTIPVDKVLHLKTGVSYLERNVMAVSGEFVGHPAFDGFHILVLPEDEPYAAGCTWFNERVFMPAGFPKSRRLIASAGYEVVALEMSEFQKLEGGLGCLSLRF